MDPFHRYVDFKNGLLHVETELTETMRVLKASEVARETYTASRTSAEEMLKDSEARMFSFGKMIAPEVVAPPSSGEDIIERANLVLDEARILNSQGQLGLYAKNRPTWNDVTRLTGTLNSLRTKGYINKKEVYTLEQVSNNLSKALFEARELQRISEALASKLSEEAEQHGLGQELARYEQVLQDLTPDVENCENLFEAAMLNGDVGIAEEIAYNQIALQERMLKLVEDQYPAIQHKQADAKHARRQRRWAIFRTAGSDINGVADNKSRHIESCEEDIARLSTYVKEKETELGQKEEQLDADRIEAIKFLDTNAQKQRNVFLTIEDLCAKLTEAENDLRHLQHERVTEVKRVVQLEEEFCEYSNKTKGFLSGAEMFLDRLRNTLDSSLLARDVCSMLQDFLLGGVANIELKFDKADSMLAELEMKVDRQFLKYLTSYFLNVGRLVHKKQAKTKALDEQIQTAQVRLEFCVDSLDPQAKRHALDRDELKRQRDQIGAQISVLCGKLENMRVQWEPVAKRLRAAGAVFADPDDLVAQSSLNRHQKILGMRETMNVTEAKVNKALDSESINVQVAREDLRVSMMNQQQAKHASIGLKQPRPPASAQAQAHNKAHSRYLQMCNDLKLDEMSVHPGPRSHMSTTSGNGGVTAKDLISRTIAQTSPKKKTISAVGDPNERSVSFVDDDIGLSSSENHSSSRKSSKSVPHLQDVHDLVGKTVVARYSYKSRAPDELSFVKGDLIVCVSPGGEEGWFVGVCNQRTGMFPYNYVNIVDPDDEFDF
eukprot:PhM_4_TR13597/c0_g1_i1/m.63680